MPETMSVVIADASSLLKHGNTLNQQITSNYNKHAGTASNHRYLQPLS
jgi:hypothetical protein